jgi:putative ABC transport system permease protein
MIRTLRALGLPLRAVAGLMTAELLALALLGGALGVALGGWIAAALLPDVAASLRGLYGAEVSGTLTIRPGWWLSGLAMALGGTLLAGGAALVHLARMPLLAPARPRAWARSGARLAATTAVVGSVLILLAGAIFLWGHGLLAGFAGLGALLLGSALVLPWLLARVLALGASLSTGVVARWVWADTGQQLPGLSLALMALMLALAANIGVSTMVGSFRQTFVGYLDQKLSADLYVIARDDAEVGRLEAWLAPRSDAVLPIWRSQTTVSGMPVTLYGFRDDATYRENWPVLSGLPDLWNRAAMGDGVLVNEQMARRRKLTPGDAIGIEGWRTTVLGVYSDYGNPTGEVMMALDRLLALPPPVDRRRFGVRIAPGRAGALKAGLETEVGLPSGAITDQASQKRAALAVFERTFLVTGALNVLTLGVAGFAMLTALVTLSGMRLPQLAPVWAMGLDRRRLAALEVLRAVVLAVLTWVVALPVGIALAWALLAVINVEAFGWKLPLHLYPGAMLGLLGGAVLAAVLAAALPALRLARRPVGDLLRVFAGER